MPLIYQKIIKREDLRRNPEVLYVFGDNMQRVGLGGQAAEMRGEINAAGVVTKMAPTMLEDAFFTDFHFDIIMHQIRNDLQCVYNAVKNGWVAVWPADGIGTGLSQLPTRAPKIWRELENYRKELETYHKRR